MDEAPPRVYLLHGENEYGIAMHIAAMESKLDDPTLKQANITKLDGESFQLDNLLSEVGVIPFMVERRIVLLNHPTAQLEPKDSDQRKPPSKRMLEARKRFLHALEKVPPSTALVLIEARELTLYKEKRRGKLHWLVEWATSKNWVYVKEFLAPRGPQMADWIRVQAAEYGGEITYEAADLLASLVGVDSRLANQEIQKLLSFVNYSRAVKPEDVEKLCVDASQANIFTMVDAIGHKNGREAVSLLHRLLEQQEARNIYPMVIRQFRLLIQAREILDQGGGAQEISRRLKLPAFVAQKLVSQANKFHLQALENVYHRLLELDEAIKTSRITIDLALDTFVAELTS